MVLYDVLHEVWVVKEQIFVQTAPFSISHCILYAKFCWTFDLVISNFLPDQQRFYRSGPTVILCFEKTELTAPANFYIIADNGF